MGHSWLIHGGSELLMKTAMALQAGMMSVKNIPLKTSHKMELEDFLIKNYEKPIGDTKATCFLLVMVLCTRVGDKKLGLPPYN